MRRRQAETIFAEDVVRQPDVEVAFALQNGPVADDVVGAVGQAEKHRHDQAERRGTSGCGKPRRNRIAPLSE